MVVFQLRERILPLFTFKDKINKMLHSNLVYNFKYTIYNDICHSKTKHHFKARACEHLGITPLTGKKVKSPHENVIFDHIFHTVHNASFDKFETLAKESDKYKLLLNESPLILSNDPPLNRSVKSTRLELSSKLSTI